jgi:hypothetical protein
MPQDMSLFGRSAEFLAALLSNQHPRGNRVENRQIECIKDVLAYFDVDI